MAEGHASAPGARPPVGPEPREGDAIAARVEQLDAAVAGIGAALEGHTRWLADLQTGVRDATAAVHAVGLSGQPAAPAPPGVEAESLARQLDVWLVMRWIGEVADVPEGPLVSVITTTRERPAMLARAVASVLGQSYARLELIVVDDSDAGGAADSLAGVDDDRLRVVRAPARRGPGAASNAGIDASEGEMLAILDDDNVMDSEWLRSVVWAFGGHPGADCLYGARAVEEVSAIGREGRWSLPSLDFRAYDRRSHERVNCVDANAIAWRASMNDIRFDESLRGGVDWERSLRMFARAEPLELPAISCYYHTLHAGRMTGSPGYAEDVARVRRRAHTLRPLRVHVHTEMYPVVSETYIGEDIRSLEHCGARVTVSAFTEAASVAADAAPCRLDYEAAMVEAEPDVVLMHWATHAAQTLPLLERHELPFACRVHGFDVSADAVARLLEHPLCVGVYAHPHHLALLPAGVRALIPIVGPWTELPGGDSPRDLVLSLGAGLPKKRFPFLLEALGRLPDLERRVMLASSNGLEEVPREVVALAATLDPPVEVRVNAQRDEALAAIARASVLLYTLEDEAPMGFPMAIVEAMLCGTIVIAPDRPEAHEIVGPHLRPYRSVEDIERHVREVMAGGPAIAASRAALRERGARHRDPAEVRRLYGELRNGVARHLEAATL